MLFQAIVGTENFPIGASKFHIFVCPTRRFPGQELHLNVAIRDTARPINALAMPTTFPAAPGYRDELGRWTQGTYEVAEGMVLKLFGHRKDAAVSQPIQASMFIQARETAAMRRILFRTMQWSKGQFQTVFCEGRFDIIPVEEAQRLGVSVPAHFMRFADDNHVNRVFQKTIVSEELSPRNEVAERIVVNSAGEEVEIAAPRRRRNMDL